MGILSDPETCSLGGFDLLFIAVKLEDINFDVHFSKTNASVWLKVSTSGEVCDGDKIELRRRVKSVLSSSIVSTIVHLDRGGRHLPRHGNDCLSLTVA